MIDVQFYNIWKRYYNFQFTLINVTIDKVTWPAGKHKTINEAQLTLTLCNFELVIIWEGSTNDN